MQPVTYFDEVCGQPESPAPSDEELARFGRIALLDEDAGHQPGQLEPRLGRPARLDPSDESLGRTDRAARREEHEQNRSQQELW
jgi:hypothetical protein